MPVQIEDFDASEMHTIVQNLSFPRLVGNPGEERAITYIKEKFAEVEIPLRSEPFDATMFWTGLIYQLAILLTILLTISMVVISFWEPLWNLLIILIILLIAIIGLRKAGGGQLQIIGKKIPTSNLVAEIPAAEEDHGTVLIMAHHDSKSQFLTTVQRSICMFFGVIGVVIALVGFFCNSILTLLSSPLVNTFKDLGDVGACLIFVFGVPLALNKTADKSPEFLR